MLVCGGEQTSKAQLAKIDNQYERFVTLQEKFTENHKEIISYQNKFKPILEGVEPVVGKKK